MECAVISVGTEFTSGQLVDTNAAWLSAALLNLGVSTAEHRTVGDDVDRLTRVIADAVRAHALVVVTGGLGPTADDLTRQAVAGALESPLEFREEAIRAVRAYFEAIDRPMAPCNRSQAMIPRGCEILENPRGTAPGIHWSDGSHHLVALPGVPAEMKAMFPTIAAWVAGRGGARVVGRLHSFGLSEADVGQRLADMMDRGRNPLVGTGAHDAIVTVRVIARGADEPAARRHLGGDFREIRRRLGPAVFGEEDEGLEHAVGKLLLRVGRTVATAESCTGGLIAKRLTDVPGSSGWFREGIVAYANASKAVRLGVAAELMSASGAVSEAVVAAMARSVRVGIGSDYSLATTGIAGPGGGRPEKPVGLVYIGLGTPEGVTVKRRLFGSHMGRSEIRDRSCKVALNMLRLHLLERP